MCQGRLVQACVLAEDFVGMVKTLGPAIIIIPLIAVLENMAIAKAFGKFSAHGYHLQYCSINKLFFYQISCMFFLDHCFNLQIHEVFLKLQMQYIALPKKSSVVKAFLKIPLSADCDQSWTRAGETALSMEHGRCNGIYMIPQSHLSWIHQP